MYHFESFTKSAVKHKAVTLSHGWLRGLLNAWLPGLIRRQVCFQVTHGKAATDFILRYTPRLFRLGDFQLYYRSTTSDLINPELLEDCLRTIHLSPDFASAQDPYQLLFDRLVCLLHMHAIAGTLKALGREPIFEANPLDGVFILSPELFKTRLCATPTSTVVRTLPKESRSWIIDQMEGEYTMHLNDAPTTMPANATPGWVGVNMADEMLESEATFRWRQQEAISVVQELLEALGEGCIAPQSDGSTIHYRGIELSAYKNLHLLNRLDSHMDAEGLNLLTGCILQQEAKQEARRKALTASLSGETPVQPKGTALPTAPLVSGLNLV